MIDDFSHEGDTTRDALYLHLEAEEAFGLNRIPFEEPKIQPDKIPGTSPLPVQKTTDSRSLLAEIEKEVMTCEACSLREGRTKTVFGAGNPDADLMFIGEAPGFDEDRTGFPFVGKAGQLLTRMIEAMGFKREEVYIGNLLKCRPPKNRTPASTEIKACKNFIERQIRLIKPKVIVTLGAPATQTLLNREESISALRDSQYRYGPDGIWVTPTYHPAYLLRNESEKKKAWNDLQRAMNLLKEHD